MAGLWTLQYGTTIVLSLMVLVGFDSFQDDLAAESGS